MNQPNRIKLQVWLVILAVFALGAVTGASLDRVYLSRTTDKRPAGGRRGPAFMVERMAKDLNLSSEQAEAIRKVYEESRKEFPPSKLAECPGFKEARQRTHDRINALLTPEQQKLYAQREQEREARMKSGPPPQ